MCYMGQWMTCFVSAHLCLHAVQCVPKSVLISSMFHPCFISVEYIIMRRDSEMTLKLSVCWIGRWENRSQVSHSHARDVISHPMSLGTSHQVQSEASMIFLHSTCFGGGYCVSPVWGRLEKVGVCRERWEIHSGGVMLQAAQSSFSCVPSQTAFFFFFFFPVWDRLSRLLFFTPTSICTALVTSH